MYDGTKFNMTGNTLRREISLGTTSSHGYETIFLGNNIVSTSQNGMTGVLGLYNAKTNVLRITAEKNNSTTNRYWYLPDLNSNRYFVTRNADGSLGSES